ncbi:MAG: SDR family oxidoreductase [Bacteroidetes bacterium]|nr:SDR family oxidoreductase [Bacteroidota bacterium]
MKSNDVVIITGASSGIGLACVEAFYHAGCRVVASARSYDKLLETGRRLGAGSDRYLAVETDVSKESDCEKLINSALSQFGRIDVLINNAGITMRALFEEIDIKVMRQIMDVNFWGVVYCTRFALPHLQKSRGIIVGMSSVAGYKGLPTRSGYSASKFAVEGLLETIRIENLKKGVAVCIARPGFVATDIRNKMLSADGTQQGVSHKDEEKSMSPEEVARHLLKAVAKRKRTMILSRTAILSFWINKFFPSWLDRQMFSHVAGEKDSPLRD